MNNIPGQAARKAHKAQHRWPPCKKKLNLKKTYTCAQCRNTNRLVINRELLNLDIQQCYKYEIKTNTYIVLIK